MKHLLHLKPKGIYKLGVWLIALTGVIAAVVMLFSHMVGTEFIDHPQFTYFHEYKHIKERISDNGALFWFNAFFCLDLIWAPSVLLLIYNLTRQLMNKPRFLKVLLVLSSAAYGFDILEGILYTLGGSLVENHNNLLSQIVKTKNGLYAIVIFFLLIAAYQRYITENLKLISRALRSSFLSLLIIVLILFLATKQEQGSTVIIHLLYSPFSILVCSMMVFMLALACAHYPDYMQKYLFEKGNADIHWKLDRVGFFTSILGMGIIYYDDSLLKNNPLYQKELKIGEMVRKNLGGALLLTWIFSLLYVLSKYLVFPLPMSLIFLFLLLYYTSTFVRCYQEKHYSDKSNAPFEAKVRSSFIFLLCSLSITLLSCLFLSWILTCSLLIVTATCNLRFYIYFQFFRSGLTLNSGKIQQIFSVGRHEQYLKIFAFIGWLALFIYLSFLFSPPALSALGFILLWMYLMYGVVVILMKHNLYYQEDSQTVNTIKPHSMTTFFRSYIPILGFLFIGLMIYSGQAGNGLHLLPAKAETVSDMPMDTFARNAASKKYFLATYGGGLRGTIWTMLLLNSAELAEKHFLDSTVAMSGVSGGFLGLSFYTAILNEHDHDTINQQKAIERIGKHNMLSIDISYMLGPDFLKEAIPYVGCLGDDRALRSMCEYADLILDHSSEKSALLDDSYRSYWTKAYHQNGYMPALIGNTTGTRHKYGVAFSLAADNMKSIFPGALNILDIEKVISDTSGKKESISYLGASSTTERFPLFSPTAQINGLGHFVDGGYFENSGLLSLRNFRDYYLKVDTLRNAENDKIILIINSKEDYIRMVLDDLLVTKNEVPSGEFGAILSTVTDIDILPHALEARCLEEYGENRFIRIYLPYKITFDDVIRIIGGEPRDPFAIDSVITISNMKIRKVLGDAYNTHVYPALARVLSDPAYEYMKKMIKHDDVQKAIAQIYK